MSDLNLYLDVQNSVLVASILTTSPAKVPIFTQDDERSINIYPLTPTGLFATPYSLATGWAASTIVFGLCGGSGKPTGTTGGPPRIAVQETWVWDTDHFTATLDASSDEYATFLGSSPYRETTLEIQQTDAGGKSTRFQAKAIAKAAVNEAIGTGPVATPTAFSKAESDNRFVKRVGLPGESVLLVSPDGTKAIELSCDNAGQLSTVTIDPYVG